MSAAEAKSKEALASQARIESTLGAVEAERAATKTEFEKTFLLNVPKKLALNDQIKMFDEEIEAQGKELDEATRLAGTARASLDAARRAQQEATEAAARLSSEAEAAAAEVRQTAAAKASALVEAAGQRATTLTTDAKERAAPLLQSAEEAERQAVQTLRGV